MSVTHVPRAALALGLAVAAVALAACGGDNGATATGNGTDRAFVAEMVPHHRSAVEMAKMAQTMSRKPRIKALAGGIIRAQNAEIATLGAIGNELDAAGVKQGSLGMPMKDMGMDKSAGMLEDAKPFDREFIDMMIPHHQGAIRMARVELAKGANPELKRIADAIVAGQSKEIDQMNGWRVDWFGKMSPAGGAPPAKHDSGHSDMTGMNMG